MHAACKHKMGEGKLFCEGCAAVRDSLDDDWRAITAQERERNRALYACFDFEKLIQFIAKQPVGVANMVVAVGASTAHVSIRVPKRDAEIDGPNGTTRKWFQTIKTPKTLSQT